MLCTVVESIRIPYSTEMRCSHIKTAMKQFLASCSKQNDIARTKTIIHIATVALMSLEMRELSDMKNTVTSVSIYRGISRRF